MPNEVLEQSATDEEFINLAAMVLMRRHGSRAWLAAVHRAERARRDGLDGAGPLWEGICRAIEQATPATRPEGEPLH